MDQDRTKRADNNTDGEYNSNIFLKPKPDGRIKIILGLKSFNRHYVNEVHFKLKTLQSVVTAVRKGYFGSVAISDEFYNVPLYKADRRSFRFIFEGVKNISLRNLS